MACVKEREIQILGAMPQKFQVLKNTDYQTSRYKAFSLKILGPSFVVYPIVYYSLTALEQVNVFKMVHFATPVHCISEIITSLVFRYCPKPAKPTKFVNILKKGKQP